MSSQALYRKWRSQTFLDLVGQEHIVQALRNAISSGRIGHAYLFTGPRGVGKTSAARILSKAVNCEAALAERPCGVCPTCQTIAEGRAVDVIEMDAASHTSVDDAREIIERVQFRPTSLRYKVYVIDEVHMLSTAAFNALLKTLEEPPDHAIFILATTEFHKVPATIISRCQRFVFNRHTTSNTVEHLEHIAQAEGVQLEPGVAEAISRAATGSMRDAVSLLDQLIGYGDALVPLERVRSLLGATAAEEVFALTAALAAGDTAAALRTINAVADQGADLRQFTRDMVSHLRGLMLLKAQGAENLLDVGIDALQAMQASAQELELGALLAWLKIFSGLDQQLRTSPYGQLPLEMAVVEALVAPRPSVEATSAIPVRATSVSRKAAAATAPAPASSRRSEAQPESSPIPKLAPPSVVINTAEALSESESSATHDQAATPAVPLVELPALNPLGMTLPPVNDDEGMVLAESEVLLAEIEAAWLQIIDEIKPYNPRVQALLRSCDPIAVDPDGTLVIGAQSPFHQRQLDDFANRRLVEDIIAKVMNRQIITRCELITKEQHSRASDARRQREELMKDQIVKAARNIFDARIVGVQEDT